MNPHAQRSRPRPLQVFFIAAAFALVFAGCTTTNPKAAFDDLDDAIATRTGEHVRWLYNHEESQEITKAVQALLQTNLTARSATAIALLNNRALQAQFEELGISQADLAQASRLHNPTFTGFWRLPTHSPTTVNTELELDQDLLDLLTLPARKKIAARNLEQTRLRLADAVIKTAAEAKEAFYTVQARQQLLTRFHTIMDVNEGGVELAERQREAGNITDLEFANQAAVFQQSKLEWGKAMAQVRVDRERLNRALGLWGPETNWKVADELPPLPEQEIPIEQLEARAVSQRLDLAASRTQVQNLEAALRLKRNVRWVPGISVGVNGEQDLDHSWVVGPTLSLEVPIFDQGQPAIARLAAQYRQAQRRLEATAIDIRSEVRQARDTLIATRDLAQYYGRVYLPQRLRIVNETLLQYNAMQVGPLDLVVAKANELSAEREYTEAWRDYWIARAELERAVGGKLVPENSAANRISPEQPKSEHEHEHQHQQD